jgi:hypothetical protein
MEHIPEAISVVALVVSFVAVALTRRSGESPKERKPRKKRQAREEVQAA